MFTARARVRQALPSLPWLLLEDPHQAPLDVGLPEGAAADPAMEQGHRGLRSGLPGPWHTVGAWEMFVEVEMQKKGAQRTLEQISKAITLAKLTPSPRL